MSRERPDYGDRSPENLARIFRDFGRYEAPQLEAHLYAALCAGVAEDSQMLELCAVVPPSQPPPNMLFGAVHYLLLAGLEHPLRAHYPDLGGDAPPERAYPRFRDLVLAQRDAVAEIMRSRRTQTNVIQRCTFLVPAFASLAVRASGMPLALIEVGASAGLNLAWDRYGYAYRAIGSRTQRRWGDEASPVQLVTEERGAHSPPLPEKVRVTSRVGVDLAPVDTGDPDAVCWLRALIWPEHVERHERLAAAIEMAGEDPPRLVAGDACALLPELLSVVREDTLPCVFATHALYQIPRDGRRALFDTMRAESERRPLAFVSSESTGRAWAELFTHWYEGGEREVAHLANVSPHGRWIEWLVANERTP